MLDDCRPKYLQEEVFVGLAFAPELSGLLLAFPPGADHNQHGFVSLCIQQLIVKPFRVQHRAVHLQTLVCQAKICLPGVYPGTPIFRKPFPGPIRQLPNSPLKGIIRRKTKQTPILGFADIDVRFEIEKFHAWLLMHGFRRRCILIPEGCLTIAQRFNVGCRNERSS